MGHDAAFESHALSGGVTLVFVSCGGDSPYNRFQDPYVVRESTIALASFDAPVGMGERGAPPQVVTGDWDDGRATLTSYERGRALGDCASRETFVWNGATFRLIEKDELDECRGGLRLLPLWRARPSFRAAPDDAAPMPSTLKARGGNVGGVEAATSSVDRYATDALHLARYAQASADLDGDGVAEAILLTKDPGHCGSGGCDLYVLARAGTSWRVVTEASVTRAPIRVLPSSHHGWRDLAVHVAGGGIMPGHEVELEFDGRGYPDKPTVPPATPVDRPGGRIVIGGGR